MIRKSHKEIFFDTVEETYLFNLKEDHMRHNKSTILEMFEHLSQHDTSIKQYRNNETQIIMSKFYITRLMIEPSALN